jgi:hypothetical protein
MILPEEGGNPNKCNQSISYHTIPSEKNEEKKKNIIMGLL